MMAIAARYMGYNIAVLDPTPNCPTAQVADQHIIAAYDDMDAIKKLTEQSDVITYEFENVDLEAASYIESKGKLPQGAYALEITQNRENEKNLMKEAGIPVAPFTIVRSGEECQKALESMDLPVVIKTCRGGYDGKGQLKITAKEDIEAAIAFAEQPGTFIIEQWIPFDKEISVVFTRTSSGEITFFPIAENLHKNHILYETIAPAKISDKTAEKARKATKILAEKINVVGTFAIEMFVKGEEIFINEMAPRPHNSGHYTMEACNVNQFSQHIRAICGLPLAEVTLLKKALMINVLGEDMAKAMHAFQSIPEAFIHLYGKAETKAKRKMGHVTFIANDEQQLEKYKQAFEEEHR